jgi:hypothetical protein
MPPHSGNIIGKVAHQTWFEGSSMKYDDTPAMPWYVLFQQGNLAISCHASLFFLIISPSENLAHDQAFEQTESQSQTTIVHTAS